MSSGAFASVAQTSSCLGERILVDSEGNRVIAASRRPDGSLRKELRIRPGYLHEDERERYTTRGTEFRQRVNELSKFPIGYGEASSPRTSKKKSKKKTKKIVVEPDPIPLEVETFSRSVEPFRKQTDFATSCEKGEHAKPKVECGETGTTVQNTAAPLTGAALTKRIQQLKTKLKQIAEIERKIAAGSVKVTTEHYEKVKKKNDFLAELQTLEKTLPSTNC